MRCRRLHMTRDSATHVGVSPFDETAGVEAAELSLNLTSSDSLGDSPQHGGASRGMEVQND
jgi:hypothetical protein